MYAIIDPEQERDLWFPLLTQLGFSELRLAESADDLENAVDATGYDVEGRFMRFALRSRNATYPPDELAQYKREFTIRYARPTGTPVEWQKLFERDLSILPDYMAYGWVDEDSIGDYVILNIPILQLLHNMGYLDKYLTNRRRNIDAGQSTLVPISIPELIESSGYEGLIVYHSDNHPALV